MAWAAEDANQCPGCGHPLDESTAAANEHAYEADAVRCHACRTATEYKQTFAAGDEDLAGGSTAGLLVVPVKRRP